MTFDIVPGDPQSTEVIHVPHSSRIIPYDVRAGILLSHNALERELDAMTDAFTNVIASSVSDRAAVRPWLFVYRLSRLVVDPEGFLDERDEMNAASMGAVYTRTSAGDPLREGSVDEISGLVDRFFAPYTQAFAGLVDERLTALGSATIIGLHSYPFEPLRYELHRGPRPEVCIGTDSLHTPDDLVEIAADSFVGFDVGIDSPFSGCFVPLAHHETSADVEAVMIELRRDLYLDESFQLVEPALTPIVSAITRLIDTLCGPTPINVCSGMTFHAEDVDESVLE